MSWESKPPEIKRHILQAGNRRASLKRSELSFLMDDLRDFRDEIRRRTASSWNGPATVPSLEASRALNSALRRINPRLAGVLVAIRHSNPDADSAEAQLFEPLNLVFFHLTERVRVYEHEDEATPKGKAARATVAVPMDRVFTRGDSIPTRAMDAIEEAIAVLSKDLTRETRRNKPGGYTASELYKEAEISATTFRKIRAAAGVSGPPKDTAGQYHTYSNAEIRKMADAAESGTFHNGKAIAAAWRALIGR